VTSTSVPPRPSGGAYSAPPDPLAGFKGTTSEGNEGEGRGGEGRREEGGGERRRREGGKQGEEGCTSPN